MVSKICNNNTSGQANLVFYKIHAYNTNYMHEVLFDYGCCTLSNYSNLRVSLLNSSKFCRCECRNCSTELLSNALEFRCCKEVAAAMAKLTFEGLEGSCILDHTDFDALTNVTVLEQVCPLLKDRKGRSYKFPSRGTQNAKNE